MRRAVKVLLALVMIAGVLFAFGFPVRTLLQQRQQTSTAQLRARELSAENAKLAARAARLQTNGEIAQIARQQYGLVAGNGHVYAILPPTAPSPPTPRRRP